MNMQNETLHQSPFVFLKNLIVIETVFALFPVLLLLSVDVEKFYQSIGLERSVPFVLMWTLFLMLLQIIAVSAAFVAWYMPSYVLDRDGVYFRKGPGGVLKKVIAYSQISGSKLEQGPLARRLDYGSIALFRSGQEQPVLIKDIPDPALVAGHIEGQAQKAIVDLHKTASSKPVEEFLAEGESQFVEYKSSLMWDYRQQRINKKLYTPVMKSLAAFMNSRGGHLLIGVDDEGTILGIKADFQGMKKPNLDGWENIFNLAFNSMVGVAYRRLIELEFY